MKNTLPLLIFILALTLSVQAQTPQQQDRSQAPDRPVGNAVLVAPDEDYRISAGDMVEIIIEDAPELSQAFIISSGGSIDMSFLGRVPVQGKTASELSKFIANSLREQDYLKSPVVRVTVKQYNSQTYFIQGSVRQPGRQRPSLRLQ